MRLNLSSVVVGFAVAAMLLGSVPDAAASMMTFGEGDEPTLAELEDGGVIVVGDKQFSNFVYTSSPDATPEESVVVEGFIDDDGAIGLQFNIGFVAGVTGPPILDGSLSFTVEILSPEYVFDSAALIATIGIPTASGNSGSAGIEETIVANPGNEDFGLFVENNVLNGVQGPENLFDEVVFGDDTAFTRLDITKNIFAQVGDRDGIDDFDRARLTTFRQVFTQRPSGNVIPEPATLATVALGLMITAVGRRRREV